VVAWSGQLTGPFAAARSSVAQQEQLDGFGRGCAAEQGQPAEELAEDQVEPASETALIVLDRWLTPITAGHELRPTSGTPPALVGTVMSRSASGNVLLRDGDGVLGTHRW
jgi:hypothetical protein